MDKSISCGHEKDELISRQETGEAINRIKLDLKHETFYSFYQKVLIALDEVPAVNRWIPCKERLPDKDGEYLVTFEKGYAEDYCFSDIGIAPFEVDCEGFGIWQEHFHPVSLGSLGSEWVEIPVTAWMPLPEPYKEG